MKLLCNILCSIRRIFISCSNARSEETSSSEEDPVKDEECVLRRIPCNEEYYNPALDEPTQPLAFRPRRDDLTGISVYRSLFVKPIELVQPVQIDRRYYVAELKVSDIKKLGLTVVPDPQEDEVKGHSLVPQINWNDYSRKGPTKNAIRNGKRIWPDWQTKV